MFSWTDLGLVLTGLGFLDFYQSLTFCYVFNISGPYPSICKILHGSSQKSVKQVRNIVFDENTDFQIRM